MVEESRGDLDYLGFVLPRRHNQYQADEDDMDGPRRVVSIQLGWEVQISPVGDSSTQPVCLVSIWRVVFVS